MSKKGSGKKKKKKVKVSTSQRLSDITWMGSDNKSKLLQSWKAGQPIPVRPLPPPPPPPPPPIL